MIAVAYFDATAPWAKVGDTTMKLLRVSSVFALMAVAAVPATAYAAPEYDGWYPLFGSVNFSARPGWSLTQAPKGGVLLSNGNWYPLIAY